MVDLFAGIVTAAATIALFSGALFAIAYARRRADVEHGIAALLCLAAAAHSAGSLVAARATGPLATSVADGVSWLGFVLAMPTAVHFALAYSGVPRRWGTLVAIHAAAIGSALLDASGARPASMSLVGAMAAAHRGAPRGTIGLAMCCVAAVAAVAVVAIVARAYLEGRREALAVVLGATVLLATAVNDLGVASGVLTTRVLVDVGLAGFVAGIASAQSARFAGVTRELERRTRELRTRTSELGRSYEDLRAAQEELVKKEQLAVIGELAAVIAHEVRNPLAIIANAVAGLRKQAISRQDHETLLAILDEETRRLNRLVTDLLRYARPVSVQRSDFSLADVLDRALSLVTQDRRAIRTEMRVEGHDGRIWGDSNLLRQVFDNLVVNAVQAMGAGGTVTVRVRGATEEGVDGVAVDIIDTGEGMDTQVRTRARDPFFTTRPSGTGLGLAIVDRIVDAHGGRLAIDSRAGEGTTVTVFLPTGSPNGPLQPGALAAGPLEPHPAGAIR
jgi:signal transduction histidine kinase